ncbi:some similarities with Saccharomyces cerevisiae YHR152W SPO12 Nucleolar protein of unknown function, positive regulator of mitotic exit [Maudiozyma barnettii]|uniref:Uncharacterized protein n=1 Tax=Maudiozyma barnettii TaxID=61262 RepID=A0A8H2VIJ3_9SACH|nr:uncharacterized protein KABA2_08S03432 [Kazachstania barnettii]CAB4256107.1 some similarities with Saccharomyces cerevisiae YHR152W SPO12 Nucleolar protein of unknown function, positive regulator of mitotic exit [Kazachstania barnettii]CAD1784715.1 some similarities with Saccharomyces cerevisiae YHR152W SPO12 Nucleolar protein of unknown function, positive regulator of mitotic exit [Kazachstania barnettii]
MSPSETLSHHYSHTKMPLHKSLFKKKSLRGKQPQPQHIDGINKYASPTDHMLSPCSKNLEKFKSNIFKIRQSKPIKLNFNDSMKQ